MSAVLLADAKAHLGATTAVSDAQIQAFIDAAELYAVSMICSPLVSTTVTERATGYGTALVLTKAPVISVTSVTDSSGAALTVGNLDVDTARGLIHWDAYGRVTFPLPFYTVVYQAGYATIPADLALGVKERVRYYYYSLKGSSNPGPDSSRAMESMARADDIFTSYTPLGFA